MMMMMDDNDDDDDYGGDDAWWWIMMMMDDDDDGWWGRWMSDDDVKRWWIMLRILFCLNLHRYYRYLHSFVTILIHHHNHQWFATFVPIIIFIIKIFLVPGHRQTEAGQGRKLDQVGDHWPKATFKIFQTSKWKKCTFSIILINFCFPFLKPEIIFAFFKNQNNCFFVKH